MNLRRVTIVTGWLAVVVAAWGAQAGAFSVCTFNVQNYCNEPFEARAPKSDESRARVIASIAAMKPQVLALQEVCNQAALNDLQSRLKDAGLDYPHAEFVDGPDKDSHVAVLSQLSITARRSSTNEAFLLAGKKQLMSRGFAEVDLMTGSGYAFTLIVVHLKSRLDSARGHEADLREQEAAILHEHVDAMLRERPNANLAVVGDFNDTPESLPVRLVRGRGNRALLDVRPVEKDGRQSNSKALDPKSNGIAWTYYYSKSETYSRVDYVFVSRGMARELDAANSHVPRDPEWRLGSDHRPLLVSFHDSDR